MSSMIKIQETDTTGISTQTYVLTTTTIDVAGTDLKPGVQSEIATRVDFIPSSNREIGGRSRVPSVSTTPDTTIINSGVGIGTWLLDLVKKHAAPLFLPNGYPYTVRPDYTPYQIYDSLQAFASTIAGLLSSRAVLQSLGFDDSSETSATSTATYATLLSIAQSTIGNVSTILFANYASSRISIEVKFYRFLADIVNDTAFLLDLISPSLPSVMRVPSLCLSSACRAVCGVAGGSSKAVLSAHFAVDGNIGELNAKDGSQETVIGLIGMWIGGVVVAKVESAWATWCWMTALLVLHLWFNYLAVKSVRLRTFNPGRAIVVLSSLIKHGKCETVEEVGRSERIFENCCVLKNDHGKHIASVKIGSGLPELLAAMGGQRQAGSQSTRLDGDGLNRLLTMFEKEQYIIWLAPASRQAVVAFKEGVSREGQLKALCHVLRASAQLDWQTKEDQGDIFKAIFGTLSSNNNAWTEFQSRIEDAGWSISDSVLEPTPGRRLRLS